MNGKNSGWGLGCLVIFALIFGVGFLLDLVGQATAEDTLAQTQADNIGTLAEDIGKSLDVIDHSLDTIDDLSGEVVESSKAERRQNSLLIVGMIVLGIVILILVSRPRGARREA